MIAPIRIEEVENGFLIETWESGPNPREKTTFIFEKMVDMLQHIFDHFGYEGRIIIESIGEGTDD